MGHYKTFFFFKVVSSKKDLIRRAFIFWSVYILLHSIMLSLFLSLTTGKFLVTPEGSNYKLILHLTVPTLLIFFKKTGQFIR